MNNANRREKLGIFDRNQACAIASITLSILCPSSDAAARRTWAHSVWPCNPQSKKWGVAMLEEIGRNRAGSLRSRRALLELRIGANSPPSQVSIDRKCMLGLFQVNLTNR